MHTSPVDCPPSNSLLADAEVISAVVMPENMNPDWLLKGYFVARGRTRNSRQINPILRITSEICGQAEMVGHSPDQASEDRSDTVNAKPSDPIHLEGYRSPADQG